MHRRPASVDEGRSSGAEGEARRNRRIRTADYSKPTGEAPFSVPAMSGMAGRSAPFRILPSRKKVETNLIWVGRSSSNAGCLIGLCSLLSYII